MKRIFLTLFFATYYFFMPFVMVNCTAEDRPFALITDSEASASSSDFTLEQCQSMEYTVSGCLDILQQQEEEMMAQESLVSSASLMLYDFEDCQSEDDMADASLNLLAETDDETADDAAVDDENTCECVITDIIEAYQICDDLENPDKFDECLDLEDVVEEAITKCDSDDEKITDDFCSTLTA